MFIQPMFLFLFAIGSYVDSIATNSFCWKEYGELSSLHTDATSIIFLLCDSRIKFRFMTGLVFISSLSLPLMDNLKNESLPNSLEWTAGILSVSLVSSVLGWILRLIVPHHNVPWLQNCFKRELVKDKIYIWKNNECKKDPGEIGG